MISFPTLFLPRLQADEGRGLRLGMDVCPNRRQLLESFRTVQFDALGTKMVPAFGQVSSTIGRLYLANGSDGSGGWAESHKILRSF
jgi:hypothetical protein